MDGSHIVLLEFFPVVLVFCLTELY